MCIRDRSRTFYTKYTEYKKRVAHANAGGAIQREVVSIAELIPSHVQNAFARVYHESRTITPTQLVVAVESLAGHGESTEVEFFCSVRGRGASSTTASAPVAVPAVPSVAAPGAPAWLEIVRFLGDVGVLLVWPARS